MIPRTYRDGDPDGRNYIEDFAAWIKDQPQDVWLLWARTANWDNAAGIFEEMVASPECDVAVAAAVFWGDEPAFRYKSPDHFRGSLCERVIEKAANGGFAPSSFSSDPVHHIHQAQALLQTMAAHHDAPAFEIPRILLGPFTGDPARTPSYDQQTRDDLDEIFNELGGALPADEADSLARQEAGGFLWIKDFMKLPDAKRARRDLAAATSDAEALQAVFGDPLTYQRAMDRLRQKYAGGKRSPWPGRLWLFLGGLALFAVGLTLLAPLIGQGAN